MSVFKHSLDHKFFKCEEEEDHEYFVASEFNIGMKI